MNINTEFLRGFIIGFVIVAAFIALLVYLLLHRNKEACAYDERQVMVRGKAFKIGFFTSIIYDYVYGMSIVVLEKAYIDQTTAFLFGILVSVGVFAVYCIWNDAYIAVNRKPKQFMVLFAALGGINLALGIYSMLTDGLFEDGMLSFHATNLFIGIIFVILFITYALKRVFKHEEE